MKVVTFAIYKQDNIWGLESVDHSKLVRSQHSSRTRTIDSLFKHYPNLPFFHLILPATSDTKAQDYIFRKTPLDTKLWQVESIGYASRAKALSSFFARHSGITLFYITVPVKVGVELRTRGIKQ